MRFLIPLFLLVASCAQPAPRVVCRPTRCAPDEQFDTRYCSCELRDDATR